MRKLVVGVILLALLAATGFGYLYLKNSQKTATNAIQAIPVNALFIWQVNHPSKTLDHLSHNSILWEELAYTTPIHNIQKEVGIIDSVLFVRETISELIDVNPIFLSWHPTGKNGVAWLATLSLPSDLNQNNLIEELSTSGQQVQKHEVNGFDVFTTHLKPYSYHFGIDEGLFFISPNAELIESAYLQNKKEENLLSQKEFKDAYETAGNSSFGALLFNYKFLPRVFNSAVQPSILNNQLRNINKAGSWCVQDIELKSNAVMASGFSTYYDTLHHQLSWFENQQPEDHEIAEVIPFNTAAFLHYGFSNLPAWYEKKRASLEEQDLLFEHDHVIAGLENEYGFSFESNMLSWIEHEVAVGYIEGRKDNQKDKYFAITKASNISLAKKNLVELTNRTALIIDDSPTLLDSNLHYIGIPNLLAPIFGKPFDIIQNSYYTIIGKYVIWANNQQLLREVRAQYTSNQTLAESDSFLQLEEQISEESNIFLYLNIARCSKEVANVLTSNFHPKSDEDLHFLQKFQAITYQWSFERKGLFYTHGYFVHNPVYKEASYSLWELELESSASMKPIILKNHYTNAKEIFIQDDNNTIYLISNSGKVIWKRKLSEPILSDVHQIDVYANGKLQILFNTKSKVFLIDRNGNDVPGYSIELKEKATTGLTLIDYSGNKKYRILVPTKGGNLYNFDNDGKLVKGWKHKAESTNIIRPVKYFALKGKDYVIAELENGKVVGYDRRGRVRIKPLKGTITQRENESYINVGTSLSNTYLVVSDSSGTVQRLFFNGDLQKADYGNFSPNHQFKILDLNNDGSKDYLFGDKGTVIGLDEDGEQLLKIEIETGDISDLNAYRFTDGYSIGITAKDENKIYLFDRTEQLQPFFPMAGASAFTITDLNNDGQFNLLVSDKSGILYAYLLDQ